MRARMCLSIHLSHSSFLAYYDTPQGILIDLIFFGFHRFERYPEDNAAAAYGQPTSSDPFGDQFPDFDYSSS